MGTKRRSMIDADQVARCRMILESDYITNFETRMVAEINLYWYMYEHCSGSRVDLLKAQSALYTWKQEWKFVLGKKYVITSISPTLTACRATPIPVLGDGI
jgi:hypothetical protein